MNKQIIPMEGPPSNAAEQMVRAAVQFEKGEVPLRSVATTLPRSPISQMPEFRVLMGL
ncbi:hypothetical protein AB0J35_22940 [Nonomuraea angiospora]|uniref:hypothetical protein n=1 Tax=Nonomuraea angiospora TaxID=46172 RepID=UPI003437FDCE